MGIGAYLVSLAVVSACAANLDNGTNKKSIRTTTTSDALQHAVQIMQFGSDNKFIMDNSNLKKIMQNVEPDTEVAVISITGEYRLGKSFLMNFFTQYLKQRRETGTPIQPQASSVEQQGLIQHGNHSWLRDIVPGTGFSFKSSQDRVTIGIYAWPEAFVIRKKDRKLAIVLIDSQGLYDDHTTPDENSQLFTLVSLISSSLIINVGQQLNSDKMSSQERFLEYAAFRSKSVDDFKLFQRITYLLRNFDHECGWEGGMTNLNKFINVTKSPKDEVGQAKAKIADALKNSFSRIDAFGLPHPGSAVKSKHYNGSVKTIDPEFTFFLEAFILNISEAAEPRYYMEQRVTAATFVEFLTIVTNDINSRKTSSQFFEALILKKRTETEAAIGRKFNMFVEDVKMQRDSSSFVTYPTWCKTQDVMDAIANLAVQQKNKILTSFGKETISKRETKVIEDQSITALQDLKMRMDEWIKREVPHMEEVIKSRITKHYREILSDIKDKEAKKLDAFMHWYPRKGDNFYNLFSDINEVHKNISRAADLQIQSQIDSYRFHSCHLTGSMDEAAIQAFFPLSFHDTMRSLLRGEFDANMTQKLQCYTNDHFAKIKALNRGLMVAGSGHFYACYNRYCVSTCTLLSWKGIGGYNWCYLKPSSYRCNYHWDCKENSNHGCSSPCSETAHSPWAQRSCPDSNYSKCKIVKSVAWP